VVRHGHAPRRTEARDRSALAARLGAQARGEIGRPVKHATTNDGTAKKWPKGARHPNLIKFAGHLRRNNVSADEIFAMLSLMNQNRCDPPYPPDHIRQMADWIARKPADARFDLFSERAMQEPESDGRDEIPVSPADVEAAVDRGDRGERPGGGDSSRARTGEDQAAVPRGDAKRNWWLHFKRASPESLQREFDRAIADAEGEKPKSNLLVMPPGPPAGSENAPPVPGGGRDLRWYPLTDAGNSERMAALFGEDIRYCVEMQRWLVWDGKRWAVDRDGHDPAAVCADDAHAARAGGRISLA
jgi:hypothetical protein